jgi:hypothetical protein
MQKDVGNQLPTLRVPELAQQQVVADADDRDVNSGGRLHRRTAEESPSVLPDGDKRKDQRYQQIGQDREKAEEGDDDAHQRLASAGPLREHEVKLQNECKPAGRRPGCGPDPRPSPRPERRVRAHGRIVTNVLRTSGQSPKMNA